MTTGLTHAFGSLALAAARSRPSESAGQVAVAQQVVADGLDAVVGLDRVAVEAMVALRQPLLTKFMTSITGIGSAASVTILLGLFYLAGWRRELAVGAVALSLAGVVVVSLMGAVQRPFPPQPVCITDDTGMTPHSFPSGHAAAATVYALVSRGSDRLPFAVVGTLAVLVAVSRMYLGTHYLSDTVAGVAIGAGAFFAGRALVDSYGDALSGSLREQDR